MAWRFILSVNVEPAPGAIVAAIVKQLEGGLVKLDEAITAYQRGALLKQHCEQKLAEAKMKVEKIVFSADGTVGSQPTDLS